MSVETAVTALRSGFCLDLSYDGLHRLVEVHAVGVSTAGNECMRVYQVSGGSISGEREGWKMMTFDKTFTATVSSVASAAPRPGYAPNDRGMTTIYAQL
jgi:hypothetical protein